MVENHTNKDEAPPMTLPPPPNLPQYGKVTAETYSPEADLMISRTIRGAVTHELVRTHIPTDAKEVATLLAVLKDQDAQALGIIRAKIEKDANDLSHESVALAREILHGLQGVDASNLPYTRTGEVAALPELPDDATVRDFVPGEMDVGSTNLNLEDFKKRVGGDIAFAENDKEDE